MQKNNNNMNKIVLGSVIATSAVILSTSGLATQSNLRVFASAIPTTVSISNSSFVDGSVTPNNWSSISSQNSSVVARIVNTNADEFENNKEDYKLTTNPGKVSSGVDNNVFMINSKNIATSYGYQSNEFSLASNGYYVISVPVRTQGTAWASVYLVDENNDFKLKCENITATDSYKTYTFYVATQTQSLNVSLQLYLGSENNTSKGAVFFDEIKAYSYAESTFFSLYQERNNNSASYVPSYITRTWSTVDNNKLTKISEDGSNANAEGFIQKVYSLSDATLPEGVANPTNGNMIDNNYALLLNNKAEACVGVRYDVPVNFKTYDYVLYSTYVKTNTSTGGVTLKLVEKNNKGEFVAVGDAISGFKSTTSDNKFNGWEKVTFAIKTSAFKDKEVYTEYWLGNNNSKAKGYAFIGKNEVVSITSEEYGNISTSSSLVKVEFDDITEDSSSFNNHSFNDFEKNADYNNVRSFVKPANLEKTDNLVNNYGTWNKTDNFASGIINTNSAVFAQSGYPFSNPGLTPYQEHLNIETQTNNVLAIYQNSNTAQGYKTNSVSLTSGSYYKISVYVKTQVFTALSSGMGIDNVWGGASWTLTSNDVVISEFNNIVANSEWITLSTYIQTGLDNIDVTANLSLGNSALKCSGVAFFDDMMVETATETEFKNAVIGNFVNVVDFKNDKFNLISENKNGYGLYESKNWTTSQTDANAVTGVYDTQDVNNAVTSNFPNMPALTTQDNSRYVLFINNKADLATSYSNIISQKLASGSYYKVSVWAKVHALSQSDVNTQYEDENNENAIPYGAFISIDNVEDSFKAITNTEWKEYIFYVNSDTDIDLKLNLGLGADNALTSGYAYFSNVLVEKMEEDAYKVATATFEEETPNNVIMVKTAKTEDDTENEDTTKPDAGSLNYIIIPTLITGLALVIAIVGALIRQINFNKFVKLKKKSNSYDRRKANTKMKSVRRAEIENLVKEKIEELNSNLEKLEELKVEQEQQVLQAKEKYLSYKNKKLSKEERKEKRLAKQAYYEVYNKLSNTYVDINIIKDDIAKIKSERYILKEEYAIMLEEWREQKKALKLEKKNQKAKQKINKD